MDVSLSLTCHFLSESSHLLCELTLNKALRFLELSIVLGKLTDSHLIFTNLLMQVRITLLKLLSELPDSSVLGLKTELKTLNLLSKICLLGRLNFLNSLVFHDELRFVLFDFLEVVIPFLLELSSELLHLVSTADGLGFAGDVDDLSDGCR